MAKNKSIEELAGVHLGKNNTYETPTKKDASLLVPVPRALNREQYKILDYDLPFFGADVWNCYETSFLLENGFPVSGHTKIVYPCNSENIVESKSLKLYLNSFNMHKLDEDITRAREEFESIVSNDICNIVVCEDVDVSLTEPYSINDYTLPPFHGLNFDVLEQIVKIEDLSFNFKKYKEDPNLLVTVPGKKTPSKFTSYSLRSNCRVTNQPDWGDIFIYIEGKKTVTPESLLQYIISMRGENHFHEEICEMVYKRLYDLLAPERLMVTCLYTRRGGIDINPIRCSDNDLLEKHCFRLVDGIQLITKTQRQ